LRLLFDVDGFWLPLTVAGALSAAEDGEGEVSGGAKSGLSRGPLRSMVGVPGDEEGVKCGHSA
jgi:hypothetical protein